MLCASSHQTAFRAPCSPGCSFPTGRLRSGNCGRLRNPVYQPLLLLCALRVPLKKHWPPGLKLCGWRCSARPALSHTLCREAGPILHFPWLPRSPAPSAGAVLPLLQCPLRSPLATGGACWTVSCPSPHLLSFRRGVPSPQSVQHLRAVTVPHQ